MMLRWSSLRRAIKITKYPHSVANSTLSGAEVKSEQAEKPEVTDKERSKLVAAAFVSLKELSIKSKRRAPSQVELLIANADNVDALLSIADNHVSKHDALKIISKLADWAGMGKIKMSDFESDVRYAKICRSLGQKGVEQGLGDLSVVLGVTADDNAAKLISSISLSQMVKVMNTLAVKGRRSTPVLRSLSFNIARSTDLLNLKEAADVFYACAILNFPDEVLLAKVTADITASLENDDSKDKNKPDLINSIVTSVGILKYKDIELLEILCNWIVKNSSICRAKHYISLVLTLANINYIPEKFSCIHQLLKPLLKEHEMANHRDWLDLVWSLVVLQKFDEYLLNSVLNPTFIKKLKSSDGNIDFVTKMKLLNINGAAQQLGSSYEKELLPKTSDIFDLPLTRTKEKQLMINCIKDTLVNICDISQHFKTDVNTEMGFLIDFECRLNSSSQLIKTSEWSKGKEYKAAIMALNYHDVCRGTNEDPHGRTALYYRLLENAGYNVISIPFYEFSPRDKLISRVQYLEKKIKCCIQRLN